MGKHECRFGFSDAVTVTRTGESGIVVGVAFYKRTNQPQYLLQYTTADGRASDAWFMDDELREWRPEGGGDS
jgi:hypothetical protein